MFKVNDKVTLSQEEATGDRVQYHSPAIIEREIPGGFILKGFEKWENGGIPITVTMRPEGSTKGIEETGILHPDGRFIV